MLGQPDRLAQWDEIDTGIASALVEVECHLATALMWRERSNAELVMAAHDAALATAARASGLRAIGV